MTTNNLYISIAPLSEIEEWIIGMSEAMRVSSPESSTSRIPSSERRTKFKPFYTKLRTFTKLKKKWDSYNAEAPNFLAIAKTRVVLNKLQELNFIPTDVCPSVEGGTSIYFIKGDKYADFEFFNSGEILSGISDRENKFDVWDVDLDDLDTSIERLKQFLND